MRGAIGRPDLFRTYETRVPPYECTIVDASRATFAWTALFPPAEVQIRYGLQVVYVDGGLGYNNPTSLAVQEAEDIWGPDRTIGCIVSIGTGISGYTRFEGSELVLARKLLDNLADCQAVHLSMDRRFGGMEKRVYYRFDPPNDLSRIGLDEWEKFDEVCSLVHAYLEEDQGKARDCITALTHPVIQEAVALRTMVRAANQQEMHKKSLSAGSLVNIFQTAIAGRITPKAIPPFPVPFFGREDVVNEIVRVLLSTPGVGIALLGSGGIGKTAVATAVLRQRRVEEAFGAFRFFVRCDSATASSGGATPSVSSVSNAAGQLISLIATQLRLDVSRGHADDILVDFFSRQPTILVLDNLETLWDGSGPDLDELFQSLFASGDLRLIVTMRGTDTPWGTWHEKPLDTLDLESARKVFIEYSGKAKFRNDPFLDKILGAVDRLPLATVLLAKQAKTEPDLQSLWEEWERSRTAMVRDTRYHDDGSGSRLLSLEVSISLSLDRPLMVNNPPARILLSLLSLLPDGAAWEDLTGLVPSSSLSRGQIRPEKVLSRLALAYVAYSAPGQPNSPGHVERRLHVLAPIREFVQHKYPPGETDNQRLTKHYLNIALSEEGKDTMQRRLSPDIHNLEAITVRALRVGSEQELAVRSAYVLDRFSEDSGTDLPALTESLSDVLRNLRSPELSGMVHYMLGRAASDNKAFEEATEKFEAALRQYADITNPRAKADCILRFGLLADRMCQYEKGRERLEEALALYKEAHYRKGTADCIRHLGDFALDQGNYEGAGERYKEALAEFEDIGDRREKGVCIYGLGFVALHERKLSDVALTERKYEEARRRLENALALYEEVSDKQGKAASIYSLGDVALKEETYDEARGRFENALALYEEVSDKQGKANCINSLGHVAVKEKKYDEARGRFENALALNQELNSKQGEANCSYSLGDVALKEKKYEEARGRFESALALYEEVSDKQGKANCRYSLGDVAMKEDKYEEARGRLEEALALNEELSNKQGKANCIYSLGDIAFNEQKYEEARGRLEEALALNEELSNKQGNANCVYTLGDVALEVEKYEEARGRFEQALALYGELSKKQGKADCCFNLFDVSLKEEKYEEARGWLKEALALYE